MQWCNCINTLLTGSSDFQTPPLISNGHHHHLNQPLTLTKVQAHYGLLFCQLLLSVFRNPSTGALDLQATDSDVVS
jgi:hypothetical protein